MADRPMIFMVDDEPCVGKVTKKTLEHDGMQVTYFSSADDCLDALSSQQCDLIITDVKMPGKDGIELLVETKRRFPRIPVVVVTGFGDVPMAVRAMEAGATDFLEKPVDREQFTSAVRRALQMTKRQDACGKRGLIRQPPLFFVPDRLSGAIAEIVGSFCHDLSNALSAVLLSIEDALLTERDGQESVRSIVRHALDGVADLHGFVRQFYGVTDDLLVSMSSGEAKETVERLLRGIVSDSGIVLRISVSGFGEGFRIPHILLRVLLVPLVTNARDAIVANKRGRQRSDIDVTIESLNLFEGFRVIVSDTGRGWLGRHKQIEQSIRVGRPVSTKGHSHGFGLQNVYRVVHTLGGLLLLENNSPKGAKVELRVPWESSNEQKRNNQRTASRR